MERIERLLAEERERIETISAPDQLEERLRRALARMPAKPKRRRPSRWTAAAIAMAILLSTVGYHYEAFAYYGQRLLGFDEVMSDTLKDLNAAGLGQTVARHTVLQDGTIFTVNGVMADANELILYYTLRHPDGISEQMQQGFRLSRLTGFLTDSLGRRGVSAMNEEQTEMVGSMGFDAVSPFAKKLTLHYAEPAEGNVTVDGSLSFPYHPSKALQTQIKQSIQKKVTVDQGKVTFGSITATPLSTVVKGTWHVDNLSRVQLPFDDIALIANGKPVLLEGSGYSSTIRGRTFELRYGPLPEPLVSLKLVVRSFPGYAKVEVKADVSRERPAEPIDIGGKLLWIRDTVVTEEGTAITIATDPDVLLDGVSLETSDGAAELRTTVRQMEIEGEDGRTLKERTLLFDSTGEPAYMRIEGMHYRKSYDKHIEIPVK